MKILVTGSAGKLGQWVVRELKSHQHHVTTFDLQAGAETVDRERIGDIEDLEEVADAAAGMDAILHLAGIRTPCRPQDCYGLSKVALEAVGRSFADRCGMTTVFIRAPWIASPEELAEVARNNGRPIKEFGLYHYIDVRDAAEACRLAIEVTLAGSHALFVGSGESSVSIPLAELFPQLAPAISNRAAKLTGNCGAVSIECARKLLGWAPLRSWRRDSALLRPVPLEAR